ncbi:hypothetical protein RJ639_043237 [Escallonia herrerae]|uniref:Ninja-family protein n=1 Tax=Escallonia herrerae TaxID=1293975 RepID=A0AA88WD89_9ASTE|nr:hypothetical protein RJ639_043237 [Escallonia herrerae]
MEDDNGLELSLGLPCGGSSVISKGKNGSSSDSRTEEGDRGSKIIDIFRNFLHDGTQKQDFGTMSQRSDLVKPEENFFNVLSKEAVNADASTNLNSGGYWLGNDNRSVEVEEEKRPEAGNKRKNLFDEINHQRKREREVQHADLYEKTRTSHISITTDEGSTAENEDVADSEADGSTSKLAPHLDDGSKRYVGGGGLPEVPKEVNRVSDSGGVDLQEQRRFTISSGNEFKHGNMPYSVQFPTQSVNIMNASYSQPVKDTNHPIGAPAMSCYSLPGIMQVMTGANGERPTTQPVMPANLPMMFGYSPVQLPMLDKDNSWGPVSHSQQFHQSTVCRGPPNSDKQNDGLKTSQACVSIGQKSFETTQHDGRKLVLAHGDGKRHNTEEGSSSQAEDDAKGNSIRRTDAADQPRIEGIASEVRTIRPGIATDLKFGGCGSYPNLPWVSTTSPGANGRTISGVPYRFSATQIRIVCACHGSHMSPEEFVQHAGEEQTNSDTGPVLASFPASNPPASAQS